MTDERPDEDGPAGPAEPAQASEPGGTTAGAATSARPRRLTRSRDDRVIAGVCGGLGEYLGVDAVLVRIAALILVFAGGAGLILYLIGWIAMPDAPEPGDTSTAAPEPPPSAVEKTTGAILLGLVFVALGAFFLVNEIWPDFLSWKYVWPIALIAIGLAILLRPRR